MKITITSPLGEVSFILYGIIYYTILHHLPLFMLQFLGGGICVGKKRAAIYARYSSDNQQELSIEGQLDQMLEFCQKHGYEVVKQYADRGISAFLIEKRHDFLKLIEDAMEAKFDTL